MVPHFDLPRLLPAHLSLSLVPDGKVDLDPLVLLSLGGLHAPARLGSVCSDSIQINGGGDDLDVSERELGALGEDDSVENDHG